MNRIKPIHFRMEQNPHRNPNRLHITISSLTFNFPLSCLNIVYDRFLNYWDLEIVTFSVSLWGQSGEFVEFYCVVADFNYIC